MIYKMVAWLLETTFRVTSEFFHPVPRHGPLCRHVCLLIPLDNKSHTGGTCPARLYKVNFEVFIPGDVKFLCCNDYAFTACDVRVIQED